MGDEQEFNKRVEEEARKARARYRDRAAFAGLSSSSESACWIETVRPLVERIVELEQAPAKVDAAHGETLIKRVGREVGPALDRWQACNDGNHSSMAAAIGPLVAANMGLEDEPREAREDGQSRAELVTVLDVRRREIDRLNGVIANLREVIAQASAAQTAGRDQASEIDDLCARLSDANAVVKRSDEDRREQRFEIERLTRDVVALNTANDALTTTVDVLAARVAARGQS